MKNRTVLIVLGIAVAMLAFILLFERESMTTDELEGRKDRVFVEFREDAVEAIAIRGTSGEEIELRRVAGDREHGDHEDHGDHGERWKIVAPRELAADGAAVRGVLAAIDYLLRDRTVRGEEVAAEPRYGLTEPRVTASFAIRGEETRFRVGADSQDGEKVYVALDATPDEFYAVEHDFFESIDLGLDDLRDKHLVEGSLGDAIALSVRGESAVLELSREEGKPWTIERDGVEVAAAEDQVADLLAGLGNLEAESFVEDGYTPESASEYGFDSEKRSATVRLPGRDDEVRLLFGKPCDAERQIHAVEQRSGTVACVADEILALLDRPPERLCEMRAAVFRDDDLAKITITRGDAELVLERDDDLGRWILAGDGAPEVEQAAVTELLSALRDSRATELVVGAAAIGELGEPAVNIALELDAGQQPIALAAWASDQTGVQLVRRGQEQAVLKIGGGLPELLSVDPLAFRRRVIENGERDDVVKLAIRGPVSQRLERDGDSWKLVEPVVIAADGASARELAGLLARVEVARYAGKAATPAHGLAAPWAVVEATIVEEKHTEDGKDRTGERELVLELGSEAGPGERFARIRGKDGAVFVLGESYTSALARPLAARDLLQVEDTKLVKIELTSGQLSLAAERKGGSWAPSSGSVSSVSVERLVADLGAIKAIRPVSFGPPPVGEDAITVRTWTEEQLASDEPTILVIGSASDDPEERGRLAWRPDQPVIHVLPARLAEDAEKLLAPGG